MASKGFWRSFSEGWNAVDPLANSLNTYWERKNVADAYNTGSRQDEQNVYGLAPEEARLAAQREADALTAKDAQEFGFDPNDPNFKQYAATQIVTGKRYGLGGEWRDTPFTDSERRAAGLKAVSEYYRKTGQIDKALAFDQMRQNEIAKDLQIKAAQNQLDVYNRQRAADEGAAGFMRFYNDVVDNPSVNETLKELREKVSTGKITQQEYEAAAANYDPRNIAGKIANAYAQGYGAPAGLNMRDAILNQTRNLLLEKAASYITKNDYQGLADFFSNNNIYNDGNTYRLDSFKDGKVTFSQIDPNGKVVGSMTATPQELLAHIAATVDPSKAISYYTAYTSAKNAEADRERQQKQFELSHALALREQERKERKDRSDDAFRWQQLNSMKAANSRNDDSNKPDKFINIPVAGKDGVTQIPHYITKSGEVYTIGGKKLTPKDIEQFEKTGFLGDSVAIQSPYFRQLTELQQMKPKDPYEYRDYQETLNDLSARHKIWYENRTRPVEDSIAEIKGMLKNGKKITPKQLIDSGYPPEVINSFDIGPNGFIRLKKERKGLGYTGKW